MNVMISADGTRKVQVVRLDGIQYYRVHQRGDAGWIWIADERDLDGLARHVDIEDLENM